MSPNVMMPRSAVGQRKLELHRPPEHDDDLLRDDQSSDCHQDLVQVPTVDRTDDDALEEIAGDAGDDHREADHRQNRR